ncbi:MAG: hypothetical protein K9N47_02605 [Prosthecobacter sp.]|uniref:hypothetical protein n=1 Tax=Prosthecobacter sp. TaxID=1965333 RepID=UPI0025E1EE04|nr:hypothetical protein [Prosthecobacter sp.]MCF7784980.1 hypothetical protein [Prosthecobacter sp.]
MDQGEVRPEIVDADLQLRICGLLREAAGVRGHSFMTILEVGMDDGMAYYVTNLNDGEFVQEYVQRRGAVPTVTSLALVHQLLLDLGKAEEQMHLHATLSLDRVLVSSQEEEYLQLRLFDYGLSQPRSDTSSQNSSRLVDESCRLLFLLMTGQTYPGGNPEDFGVIAELPASLRFVIKSVLTSRPANLSISIKTLREEVREAMCSYVNLVQARNPKLLLVAEPTTLPISQLQTLLLGEIPLKTLFGASFRIQNPELSGSHPFTISAVNVTAEQPVTLHLLPPERIVHQSDFITLPPQVWRQDPAKQINLLHMMGLWKGPDWAFLSEVHEPGMSLSALMAKRGALNPGEVITLLKQTHAGLEQALETGVHRVDLDPANIQLCVGYDGPVLPRDLERLHQKRLDAWPKFVLKLRLHKTMRSLCKPRLIDLSPWEYNSNDVSAGIAAREERHRSFICLAAYLLTGKGQMREIAEFPTSLPEQMVGYLHETLQRVLSGSTVPNPPEFTERLSHLLTASCAEMDSAEDPLASQEMESAGFVSDFEEDQAPVDDPVDLTRQTLLLAPVSDDLESLDFHRPSPPQFRFPWLALAATAMLLGAVAWMIFGDLPEFSSGFLAAAPNSQPQETVHLLEDVEESNPKPAATPPTQSLPQPIIHKIPVVADVTMPAVHEETLTSPIPVAPKPEDSPPSTHANATPEENQPAEKMVAASLPEPQIVASGNTASSIPAPEIEPVIRRAILTTQEDAKPTPADLPPKEIATNLPAPLPAPAEPPAPEPVVAVTEQPVIPSTPPAAVPPPPKEVAELQEVTIRHAIVLTPEEINETLRAQTKALKQNSRRR